MRIVSLVVMGIALGVCCSAASAATVNLGNGYRDHGVVVPISNHRGIVAAVSASNRNVVLAWLMDHRGGYELLLIDAVTGVAQEFPVPFTLTGDSPFSSILSTGGRFYSHYNSYFVEFDPVSKSFTFCSPKTAPQMAMGMTQDDSGVIWSVTYPQSGVCSFNPTTRVFRDYGQVYKQNWSQYQRSVASDNLGWIYWAVGNTASQIVAFNPTTGVATPLLPESARKLGTAYVYRNVNGKCYGQALSGTNPWYELYNGVATQLTSHTVNAKSYITGDQNLFYKNFPNGDKIYSLSVPDRTLTIQRAAGGYQTFNFNYNSEGAVIMGVGTAPDNTIYGGTAFPMDFFNYTPGTDALVYRPAYGQWNAINRGIDRVFVAAYSGGHLLEWDPAKAWVATVVGNPSRNPVYLDTANPDIGRPTEVFPYDNNTIIMAGTPAYGYTGGGLMFWNRSAKTKVVLSDTAVIPNQSTAALVRTKTGEIFAGTTTTPGTGGEKKATVAELYLMNPSTRTVTWHAPLIAGVQTYQDLANAPGQMRGLIYGIGDRKIFFVFDPVAKQIVYQKDMQAEFGFSASQQGTRVFVPGPGDKMYMCFLDGIVQVEMSALRGLQMRFTRLSSSPIDIAAGGDYLDGRIYFANGSHLYSYQLP